MPRRKLSNEHTDFTFSKVTPIIYKTLSLDRVFTNLLPKLKYGGLKVIGDRNNVLTVQGLADQIARDSVHFAGFADQPEILYKWVQSDFVDLINRGKAKEKVSAPIPLNINTYKLRNARETLDYGMVDQIFSLLYHHSPKALRALKDFLEEGTNPQTDKFDDTKNVDIDWLVILRLLDRTSPDDADRSVSPDPPLKPHCAGQGRILGDDILRIIAYKEHMPRRALIDSLKTLIAFHVALYMFRLTHIIPYIVMNGAEHSVCKDCPVHEGADDLFKSCAFPVQLVVDMGDDHRTMIADISRQSYLEQVLQHDTHIRSQLKLKKLHELAVDLDMEDHKNRKEYSLVQLLTLPQKEKPMKIELFFRSRTQNLLKETKDNDSADPQEGFDPRLLAIKAMELSEMDKYIEMLYLVRQNFLQSFFERMFDSLLQRNTEHGLLKSGFGRVNSKRRFAMGSRMLEMLVHIALLGKDEKDDYYTRRLRLDEFTTWLENRYGLFSITPPNRSRMDIPDLVAFRSNAEQFASRMREIGFYKTLSDAYISQVIQPRFKIGTSEIHK